MLIRRDDLDLRDVISLDKVQKGKPLCEEKFKGLNEQKRNFVTNLLQEMRK